MADMQGKKPGAADGRPLLSVEHLKTHFDVTKGIFSKRQIVKAVDDVSITIPAGKTVGLVGESGCGKSMTAMSVMGLVGKPGKVTEGRILYRRDGEEAQDLLALPAKARRQISGDKLSMIFQEPMVSLDPLFPIGDQLGEVVRLHKKVSQAQANEMSIEMLRTVGIPSPETRLKQYPFELSGGMRQRVMIAIALLCDPELLIADEPTTALDVTMQAQILDLMNHLKEKRGTSILLITHDLGVVAKMADRIAVMYAGKIVEYGDARQVFYRPSHPYTWGLLGAMPNLIQDVKSELYAIPGTPPDLYAPPKGCAFAARCPYAMEACLKEDPQEFACGQGHGSRCWLLDPRAPDVTPPEGIPPLPKGGSDHV